MDADSKAKPVPADPGQTGTVPPATVPPAPKTEDSSSDQGTELHIIQTPQDEPAPGAGTSVDAPAEPPVADTPPADPALTLPPPVDAPPADAPAAPPAETKSPAQLLADAVAEPVPAAAMPQVIEPSGQQSIKEEQSNLEAQIEAAASKLDAGPPVTGNNTVTATDSNTIGQAIDLETTVPQAEPKPGLVPASPYTPDPYAKPPAKPRRHSPSRMKVGIALICMAILLCVGVGAYSVWYVKTNVLSSVKYTNFQPVSVKGTETGGGFVVEVPAEYSEDNKTGDGIEYSHHVPSNKGEGNYSGIAINTSEVTDASQVGQIDQLKDALRIKDSEASKQFVTLINGSLSGQQEVTLDSFIEKTNTYGQKFFGYDIILKSGETPVGKGWMLITTSEKHVYVIVLYGTNKVWTDNTTAWQSIFDSLQVNTK